MDMVDKKIQGLDFVNTQGIALTTLMDQNSDVFMERTPATDEAWLNTGTNVQMSLKNYEEIVGSKDGKNIWWTTDLNQELPIKMGNEGVSKNLVPQTLCGIFRNAAQMRSHNIAMRVMRNDREEMWSWSQWYNDALAFSKGLEKIGVSERSSVNIMGFNSPEWAICLMGSIMHHNIVSGVYTTNTPEVIQYQASHSKAQVLVVDTQVAFNKYVSILDQLPNIKAIVIWGDEVPAACRNDKRFFKWSDFLLLGKEIPTQRIDHLIDKQKPGMCCVLIYTSGTTGMPKGVMLSHDNMTFTTTTFFSDNRMMMPNDHKMKYPIRENRMLTYLPFSHVASMTIDLIGQILFGSELYYARPDAMQGTLMESIRWCKPTSFWSVPRVWEKIEQALMGVINQVPHMKETLFPEETKKTFNSQTIYKKDRDNIIMALKKNLGLDKAASFSYGAAPLQESTIKFFNKIDIVLVNNYGLSETCGPSVVQFIHNQFSQWTTGMSMNGVHIKIKNADSEGKGEICMKGRHIMMGYLGNEKATRECIDENGYFCSGDQGIMVGKFVKITGRIKELIITAGGENVAPVPIEDKFKVSCSPCSNIMVVGDAQRFIAAIITLKVDPDPKSGGMSDNLMLEAQQYFKKELGLDIKKSTEACKNKQVIDHIQACTDKCNKLIISRAANIRKFKLVPYDFSVPGGHLTPTQKLKRSVTVGIYKKEIDQMFAADAKL